MRRLAAHRKATAMESPGSRLGQAYIPASPTWAAVGEGDAFDFTALGDSVNTAARLASSAPSGEILVSSAAAAAQLDTAELEHERLNFAVAPRASRPAPSLSESRMAGGDAP
jgi:hypothetical protein